jgi:hypothetical protein
MYRSEMCGGVANSTGWRDMGFIHTALLKGMVQLGGSKIYYVFGDEETNHYSRETVFYPPVPRGVELSHRPTKVKLDCDIIIDIYDHGIIIVLTRSTIMTIIDLSSAFYWLFILMLCDVY